MKKLLLMCMLISFCFVLSAEEQSKAVKPAEPSTVKKEAEATNVVPPAKWDSVQFGFWFGFPPSTQRNNVCGIKIGAPFCDGPCKVSGLETALFCGATDNIDGVQACVLVAVSKKLSGLQFSIVNIGKVINGLQLGVVNIARNESFQIGIVNYIEGNTIPVLPIINFKF